MKKQTYRKAVKVVTKKAPKLKSLVEPLDGASSLAEQHTAENKRRMLEALSKHMGVVLYACKETNVARRTHYYWMEEDPVYREAVERVNEECHDFVERKILEAINDKVPAVMIFYAKTKMRKRGYQERFEMANPSGEDFRLSNKLTIEETKKELPPESIKTIVSQIITESSRAAAALDRLSES